MNLPLDGGSYEMLEKVLDRNLPRAPNIRLLVLEFDIVPLRTDTVIMLKGDNRTLWDFGLTSADIYGAYSLKRLDADVTKALHPFLIGKALTPQQIWYNPPLGLGREKVPQRRPGYSPSDVQLDTRLTSRGAAEATTPPLDLMVVTRNRAALERIIARQRAVGIKVAFLSFPYHESYRRVFPPEYADAVLNAGNALRGEVAAWWNLESDPRFGSDDFRDTTHLNRRGGEKLTGIIAPDVERLAGVQ